MNAQEKANSLFTVLLKGRRMVFLGVRILVLVYLGLLFLLFACQKQIIFPATRGAIRSPDVLGWAYENLALDVDGETTHGWFLTVDQAKGTILFSHGNGGNIDLWLDAVAVYRRMGFNVLLYDYGGYGLSTGKPSEKRCYADIRAMWRWLTETKGLPESSIILVGRSLGAAVTAQLALEVEARAVVLESPFLSIPAMAKRSFPFFPARLLVRHVFDNEAKVGHIAAPLLIVHSREDTLVPFDHGRRLFEVAQPPKSFLEVHGDHNEWSLVSEEEYERGFLDFVTVLDTATG